MQTSFNNNPYSLPRQDTGGVDGIRRVVVGGSLVPWLHRLLLLDALAFTGGPKLATPLERSILVDVDDIFVARTGVRMKQDDVRVRFGILKQIASALESDLEA